MCRVLGPPVGTELDPKLDLFTYQDKKGDLKLDPFT